MKAVLDNLLYCNTVYFVYYSYIDIISLFRSDLLLYRDKPEKSFGENTRNSILTVESISPINTENLQLAFLSAYYTAETISSLFMDKGIYLASGFQLAGFLYVIASL